jgi:predicted 3-demethylubiquinone-9 3-methyltransferase (glyoxalase superfamily)
MAKIERFTPNLWFDTEGEDAAKFYTSIFKNSSIDKITYYPKVGQEIHGKQAGSVMTVEFNLDGQKFLALNGGPHFKFNEAISIMVICNTQKEIDELWRKLSYHKESEACGWLKDKFGLSWQIAPAIILELQSNKVTKKTKSMMKAMMQMKKLDIKKLKKAYEEG